MYCRHCGNKLLDTDNFCNVCGKKVIEDNFGIGVTLKECRQTSIIDDNKIKHNLKNKVLQSPVMKFILFMVLFCLLTVLCYSFALPARISVISFVTDSRGLTAVVSECMGASVAEMTLVMPLLYGLKKLNITNSLHRLNAFFLIMCVCLIGKILLGKALYQRFLPPVAIGALVLGIIFIAVAYFKEKCS